VDVPLATQNRKKKRMTDGLTIMKINFRDIKGIEIISFTELPEERQKFALEDIENKDKFVADMKLAIQNCLMTPDRWTEFENLTEEELFEFFWRWAISSTLEEEKELEDTTE
jgi:hypothetical protein